LAGRPVETVEVTPDGWLLGLLLVDDRSQFLGERLLPFRFGFECQVSYLVMRSSPVVPPKAFSRPTIRTISMSVARSLSGPDEEAVGRLASAVAGGGGAQRLRRDEAVRQGIMQDKAVQAALEEPPRSNGPVEGQVNRLKLIKRQMYDKGSLDLLRRRVLHRG
jgi:hypothetical protein